MALVVAVATRPLIAKIISLGIFAVTKKLPISERSRFNPQGVFLNAWNDPVFGQDASPISGNPRTGGTGYYRFRNH